jgi:Hint module
VYANYGSAGMSIARKPDQRRDFVTARGGKVVSDLFKKAGAWAKLKLLGCGCFPADTAVRTPSGDKPIASLHAGDQVLAEDPKKGKVEQETVQAVIDDGVKPLMQVALSDGSSFKVTTNHPFYIDAGGRRRSADWIAAGQLLLGDCVRTASGHDLTIVRLLSRSEPGSGMHCAMLEGARQATRRGREGLEWSARRQRSPGWSGTGRRTIPRRASWAPNITSM